MLQEHDHEVFEMEPGEESPYMLFVSPVREELRTDLDATLAAMSKRGRPELLDQLRAAAKLDGSFIDAQRGRQTFADFAEEWAAAQHQWKEGTPEAGPCKVSRRSRFVCSARPGARATSRTGRSRAAGTPTTPLSSAKTVRRSGTATASGPRTPPGPARSSPGAGAAARSAWYGRRPGRLAGRGAAGRRPRGRPVRG